MDKALLHETITELYKRTKAGELSRLERIEEITALSDAYYDSIGEHPDTFALERMANLVLYEELSDRHPDKMTREEYPFMSESQLDERYKKRLRINLRKNTTKRGAIVPNRSVGRYRPTNLFSLMRALNRSTSNAESATTILSTDVRTASLRSISQQAKG